MLQRLLALFFLINVSLGQNDDPFRLPSADILQPETYQILLTVEDFQQSLHFNGNVSIRMHAGKLAENVSQVHVHAYHSYANNITRTVFTLNSSPSDIKGINVTGRNYNETTNILTLDLEESLKASAIYILQIDYEGTLSEDTLNGFFRTSYRDYGGKTRYFLATQFETTHARKAFPCFDEPGFKSASFHLTINHPENYTALSNTALDTTRTTANKTVFKETPKMPTYLLAFVVSDFTCDSAAETIEPDGLIPYRVCSSPVTAHIREHALHKGAIILKDLANYTKIPFSTHGTGKMDQIAVTGMGGAMENWGLVTYGEDSLLYDFEHSTNKNLQGITTVIAHELAHQWFGNLVTCHWWSEAFLNEGFATYFQYFITAKSEENWELESQFAVEKIQTVLAADSSATIKPIAYAQVSKPEDISERFGTISYNKGGSVLRMIETIMSPEKFQNGLIKYLNDNKFGSGTKEKLYAALEAEKVDTLPVDITLQEVLQHWIETPGHPVLSVKSDGRNVNISQKRFFDPPVNTTNDQKWYVPISYSTEKENTGVAPKTWLLPSRDLILESVITTNDSWIVLNNEQRGFFRIDYDNVLLHRILGALHKNINVIHEVNRAQIIDDLFALAKVDRHSYTDVLDSISFLQNDQSYYPWYSFFRSFNTLYDRIGSSTLRNLFGKHALDLMTNVSASVPFRQEKLEQQVYTLKQVLVLTWACKLDEKVCVNNSLAEFDKYEASHKKPFKNLRSVIYCTALRHSQKLAQDWIFLWTEYTKTSLRVEKTAILNSLGCTKSKEYLEIYMNMAIDENGNEIEPADVALVFQSIYESNPENVDVVLDFVHNNHKKLAQSVKATTVRSIILGLAQRITHHDQIDTLNHLAVHMSDVNQNIKTAAADGVKTAENNLLFTEKIERQITGYLIKDNSSASSLAIFGTVFILSISMLLYQF